MFYSHTFLARKGPLGTVWCAAHLQHKLKKSHYTSTDIPSTVDRIIFPEVPIALRMSGHLLLGVVRIYAKKVYYLQRDCDYVQMSLKNAFRHIDVNLPENATHAQINAVTYPETYALDAVGIDDDFTIVNESQDNHLRSQEDITLRDQYHAEQELYVRIMFDDDIIPDSFQPEQWDEGDAMQIDIPPEVHTVQDAEGLNRNGEQLGRSEGESLAPHEVMRDHQDNTVHLSSPILRPHIEHVDPNLDTIHSTPKDTPEKETDTLQSIDASTPVDPHQPPQHDGPSSPPTEAHVGSGSFANVSPNELELRPTSPRENPQPQQRKRKRKQYFDESLVLTNEYLKKALNDCSDLVKKKKKMPCSDLELWRFREKKKKIEEVFSEPLISGMCVNLENLHSKDFISSNMRLLVREEAQPGFGAAGSHAHVFDVGEETERIRSVDLDPGLNFEQLFPSSPPLVPPSHGIAETSASPRIPSLVSEPRFGTTDTQSDMGMSTRSIGMDMETPNLNFEGQDDDVGTALSDIPEWRNSMEPDELSFLEQDDNSPSDSQGARTGGSMSARTRAVAEYLKNHSPLSKLSEGPEDLNLSTILEGKQRKLCARMFYETLVLKNHGLIDVKQDEPYGDIILKLTPTFSTTIT